MQSILNKAFTRLTIFSLVQLSADLGNFIYTHWKVLCLIATVSLVSTAYAYYSLSKITSSSAVSTFAVHPLELRTELNKTEFQEGEMISVRISLKNISNRTVIVVFPDTRDFGFNITDVNGKIVYSNGGMYAAFFIEIEKTLQPNTELYRTLEQNLKDDIVLVPGNQVPLPKGTYKLIGLTSIFGAYYENWESTGVQGPLTTPPITITVN